MSRYNGPIKDRNLTIIDFIIIGISLFFVVFTILVMPKNKEDAEFFIKILSTIFLLLVVIGYIIHNIHKNKMINDKISYDERKKQIKDYISKSDSKYIPTLDEPLKELSFVEFFHSKEKLTFADVFEQIINNQTIYVGDLEWSTFETETRNKRVIVRNKYNYENYKEITETIKHEIKHFVTMCVLFDKSFILPDFQIRYETTKDKILELLNLNEVQDIDFSSDKAFSDMWLLSSNESENIVRDFFNNSIRANFVKLNSKNYLICAHRNMIYILTIKPIDPHNYYTLAKELLNIRDILKLNKKYYKDNKQK